MKKKSKKPKDYLIQSVLDDLKKTPDDSIVIGPEGIVGEDLAKEDLDKTAMLGKEYDQENENEFLVQNRTTLSELKKNEVPSPFESNETALSSRPVKTKSTRAEKSVLSDDKNADRTMLLSENSSAPTDPESVQAPADGVEFPKPPKTSHFEETRVANPKPRSEAPVEPKVSFGGGRGKSSPFEAQFAQAENLKMAQQRILELEKEVERLRKENEVLSSAAEISRQKMDELVAQIHHLDKLRHELRETNESELQIFKEGLTAKDNEILRLRSKVEELESRLSNDLRKVRVRERELENRLELAKVEKAALLRSKDETILELKRKTDNLESEIEGYQNKIIELGQKLDLNQEQFARTVRALRLALTNLEVSDGTSPSITLAPLKKAE